MKHIRIGLLALCLAAVVLLAVLAAAFIKSAVIRRDAQREIDELLKITTLSFEGKECTFEAELYRPQLTVSELFRHPRCLPVNGTVRVLGAEGTSLEGAAFSYLFQFEWPDAGLRFNPATFADVR